MRARPARPTRLPPPSSGSSLRSPSGTRLPGSSRPGSSSTPPTRLASTPSVNLAATDAAIACWNDKYHYSFWRPRPAIREADTDGNPATIADPNWESLFAPATATTPPLGTPPFPDHPSGHGCLSGAVLQTMADFFGRDKVVFTVTSGRSLNGVPIPAASLRALLAGAHGGHRRPRLGRHPLPHRRPAGSRPRQEGRQVRAEELLPAGEVKDTSEEAGRAWRGLFVHSS